MQMLPTVIGETQCYTHDVAGKEKRKVCFFLNVNLTSFIPCSLQVVLLGVLGGETLNLSGHWGPLNASSPWAFNGSLKVPLNSRLLNKHIIFFPEYLQNVHLLPFQRDAK